jgi:hypothetical protein
MNAQVKGGNVGTGVSHLVLCIGNGIAFTPGTIVIIR